MLIEILFAHVGSINLVQDLRVFLYTWYQTGLDWLKVVICSCMHRSKLDEIGSGSWYVLEYMVSNWIKLVKSRDLFLYARKQTGLNWFRIVMCFLHIVFKRIKILTFKEAFAPCRYWIHKLNSNSYARSISCLFNRILGCWQYDATEQTQLAKYAFYSAYLQEELKTCNMPRTGEWTFLCIFAEHISTTSSVLRQIFCIFL
jgi:hypothetical protein